MDNPVFWLGVTVIGGILFCGAFFLWVKKKEINIDKNGNEIKLPVTPLQKKAWLSFILGCLLLIAIIVLFYFKSPEELNKNDNLRHIFTLLIFLISAVYFYFTRYIPGKNREAKILIDERDIKVAERAGHYQSSAIMFSLAVWSVLLTEIYWNAGEVPVAYISLVFWSCFAVFMISHPLGVLIAYWLGEGNE